MKATWQDLQQAIWIVQHTDGRWIVLCGSCRRRLYHGWSHPRARRAADTHHC